MQREGLEAEEKAIRYVAKVADGSMRDALSLLDQCISYYLGQTLTYDKVLEVLGSVDVEIFNELMTHVSDDNTMEALRVIDEIIWQGRELNQFVTDFTWYMRNLLLLQTADSMSSQIDIAADSLESMKVIADKVKFESLTRYIRVFSELSSEIRYSTQKRVVLELAIIKLTTPQMEVNTDSILERLRVLEKKVEEGSFSLTEEQLAALAVKQTDGNEAVIEAEAEVDREAILKKELTPAEYEDMGKIIDCLNNIKREPEAIERMGHSVMDMFKQARIHVGPDHRSLILAFGKDDRSVIARKRFEQPEARELLKQMIAEQTGLDVPIECQAKDSSVESDVSNVNLAKISKVMTIGVKLED